MGKWGYIVNVIMVTWTFFEVTILCFPETYPLTWNTFNYAVRQLLFPSSCIANVMPQAPITLAVMGLSLVWYMIAGRRYYDGPRSNVHEKSTPQKEKSEEP